MNFATKLSLILTNFISTNGKLFLLQISRKFYFLQYLIILSFLRCVSRKVHGKIKCPSCDKKFENNSNLKHHVKTVHEGIRDKVVCDLCGKSFIKSCLKRHIRMVHDQIKDHVCSHCGKAFGDKPILDFHIQVREKISLIQLLLQF